MNIIKNDINYNIIVFFLIISGILLRIVCFINNCYNINGDECNSIYASLWSIKVTFFDFMQGANMLPLYKVLLRFIFNLFGFNWILFKLPSLIAGIFSVIFFYKVVLKLFNNKILILSALALFCFNYSLIWFSAVVKPYEIEVLIILSVLNTVLSFKNLYKTTENSCYVPIARLIILTVLSIIFVYTSLPAIVVIEIYWFLIMIRDLLLKNYKNFKHLFVSQLVVLSFILFETFTLIIKMAGDSDLKNQWINGFYFKPDSFAAINSLINFVFFDYNLFDKGITDKLPDIIILIFILAFLCGIFLFVRDLFYNKSFSGLYIILPVLFFILLSFLGLFPFANRVILFLIPYFIIIILRLFDIKADDKYSSSSAALPFSHILLFTLLILCIYYIFSKALCDNSLSERNKRTIQMFENVKSDKEVIISTEKLCAYCINNKNIYTFRNFIPQAYESQKNEKTDFFFKKIKKNLYDNFDVNILENKNKIYFIDSENTDSEEQNGNLLSIIKIYGFREIYRDYNPLFISYIVFEK